MGQPKQLCAAAVTLPGGASVVMTSASSVQLSSTDGSLSSATALQETARSRGSQFGCTQTTREKPVVAPQSVIWTRAPVLPDGD